MSLRKYGALRYGFIGFAAIVASDLTFDATPQSVVVSIAEATLVQPTAGTPVIVPYQRPVAQRGIRTYGQPNPVGSLDATFGATPQTIVVSNPSASLSVAGGTGTSVPIVFRRPVFQRTYRAWGPPSPSTTPELHQTFVATPQTIVVSVPSASLAMAGVQTSPVVVKNKLLRGRLAYPRRAVQQAYGAIDELAPENFTLSATPQVVVVSVPTATLATTGGSVTVNAALFRHRTAVKPTRQVARPAQTKRITSLIQSAPGAAQSFTAAAQVIVVSNPDGTLNRIGGTSDPPILALRQAVKSTRVFGRTSKTNPIAPPQRSIPGADQSFTATPQVIVVSNPDAALTRVGGTSDPPILRLRNAVKATRVYARTSQTKPIRPIQQSVPGADQSFVGTPQVITVSNPGATFLRIGGTSDAPILQLRQTVKSTRVYLRTSKARAIAAPQQSIPGPDQSVQATPQVIVVSNPDGALNRIGGTSDPPILRLRSAVKSTRVYVRTSQARAIQKPQQSVPNLHQSFAATTQTIAVSVPTATLAAGTVTFQAARQVVCVSVPPATLGRTVAATPQVVAVRIANATLLVGTATLSASPQVVVVSAPSATFRGALTIPSTVFETTLESRLPARTLETPLEHTLETRLRNTLEVTS